MKKILKNKPFGYKTAKELYERLVIVKFIKLKDTEDINDYYDFIFSSGALRDWIQNQFLYVTNPLSGEVHFPSECKSVMTAFYPLKVAHFRSE